MKKPLQEKFRFRKRRRRIEYERPHLVCSYCGCYGHKEEDCSLRVAVQGDESPLIHALPPRAEIVIFAARLPSTTKDKEKMRMK